MLLEAAGSPRGAPRRQWRSSSAHVWQPARKHDLPSLRNSPEITGIIQPAKNLATVHIAPDRVKTKRHRCASDALAPAEAVSSQFEATSTADLDACYNPSCHSTVAGARSSDDIIGCMLCIATSAFDFWRPLPTLGLNVCKSRHPWFCLLRMAAARHAGFLHGGHQSRADVAFGKFALTTSIDKCH